MCLVAVTHWPYLVGDAPPAMLTPAPPLAKRAGREAVPEAAVFLARVMNDEADLSAEQPGARAPSRLSRADGNGGRAQRDPRAPQPRPQEAVRVASLAASPGGTGSLPLPATQSGYAVGGREGERAGAASRVTAIKLRRDFLAANSGRRAPMPGFVLLVRARGDGDPAIRLGITVTKKIGNAVVRNRMKRRFRALGHELLPSAGIPGADHVLIGRADGVERSFDQLRAELAKALAKAGR